MNPKILPILSIFILLPVLASAQRKLEAEKVVATQTLTIGKGATSHDFTSATDTIDATSTHAQIPTAKSVWDLLFGFSMGSGGHVIANNGTAVAQQDTANLVDAGDIDFTISNTTGNTNIQADLNQMGATAGQVLRWSGADWIPNGINLYDVVTTGGAVSSQFNQILVDTLSADITLNLPPCNAGNDNVSFQFMKTGPDSNAAHIEPAGSEKFNDNATTKTLYSQGTGLTCTCRFNGTIGRWYYTNM